MWKGRPALPLIGPRLRLPMGGASIVSLGGGTGTITEEKRETFAAVSVSESEFLHSHCVFCTYACGVYLCLPLSSSVSLWVLHSQNFTASFAISVCVYVGVCVLLCVSVLVFCVCVCVCVCVQMSIWGDLFYQLWSYHETTPTAPPTSIQDDSWLHEALQQEQVI